MITRKEVTKIHWVASEDQVANCLTKKGASCAMLLKITEGGVW